MTCCSERKDDSPCYECLLESVQRVRELHKPVQEVNGNGFVNIVCNGCFDEEPSTAQEFHHEYPCPTIKALDGEQ